MHATTTASLSAGQEEATRSDAQQSQSIEDAATPILPLAAAAAHAIIVPDEDDSLERNESASHQRQEPVPHPQNHAQQAAEQFQPPSQPSSQSSRAGALDMVAVPLQPGRKINAAAAWAHVWAQLEQRGWRMELGPRGDEQQTYYMPAGVHRRPPFRNRVDYFDSKLLVIRNLLGKGSAVIQVPDEDEADSQHAAAAATGAGQPGASRGAKRPLGQTGRLPAAPLRRSKNGRRSTEAAESTALVAAEACGGTPAETFRVGDSGSELERLLAEMLDEESTQLYM
mmetsp:Transcript_62310/g.148767  ORF Transcript_62310/g.148767 Transcript_62310/m.148767 type:complete len:283 (+) Transcript_62310:96-944(+)